MLVLRLNSRRPLPIACCHVVATRRSLLTIAIETSCDDSCVAVLEKFHTTDNENHPNALLHYHDKITSNNIAYKGIHPIVALESHQQNLGKLVQNALKQLPHGSKGLSDARRFLLQTHNGTSIRKKPDFISVTRGPGMRSNLFTGIDIAKGLSIALQIPLVGVHHMQAHALTPRLVSALESSTNPSNTPDFPFLSLLVSGGHTLLLESKSLTNHVILAKTCDIAIGDAIDKIARHVLPTNVLESSTSTMYGPVLEKFAFPNGELDFGDTTVQHGPHPDRTTWPWTWSIPLPYGASRSGAKAKALEYSFSGIASQVERIVTTATSKGAMAEDERRALARHAMFVCFEHLASRLALALDGPLRLAALSNERAMPEVLVVSGGVAANKFLRFVLRDHLDSRGYTNMRLLFPPVQLCTDNAAMIGWAGMEMFEAGWRSDLGILALRKWSLDPSDPDGGILGVPGWIGEKPVARYSGSGNTRAISAGAGG